jgi:DNA-binding response OmpR family regulator
MTLQDKQIGLLSDNDTADDVVDIFDQYSSGGNTNGATSSPSSTTTMPTNVTRPASDEDIANNEINSQPVDDAPVSDIFEQHGSEADGGEAKKWEEEYEDTPVATVQPPQSDKNFQQNQSAVNNIDNNDEPVTQEEKLEYLQNMQMKKQKQKDAIKIVSPPDIDDNSKEVQTLAEELNEDELIVSTGSSTPPPPEKKKYDLADVEDTMQEDISKMYVQAHTDTVVEATAATQQTAQMVKESYVPPTDKEVKAKEVHVDPSKKTILIVDDDVDTMEMYAEIFEQADYNVLRAADGLEAMSLIADHTPHIIFTGIVMPRMDGFALMEALKQNKRTVDIPVVINSHLGREEDKKRAEELGARDFIVRGFTPPREALERVGALLLRSEYIFRFDKNDLEVRKLARDLGMPNFFRCPRGQDMVLKLSITDEKELTFSARFSCMDKKK